MKSDQEVQIIITPYYKKEFNSWMEFRDEVYAVKEYLMLAGFDEEEFNMCTDIGSGMEFRLDLGLYIDKRSPFVDGYSDRFARFEDYIPYVSKLFPDLVFDCGGGYKKI